MEEKITMPKVGRYPFIAEPFHCDFRNRLFMGHLGNHMLNAADFHSNDRGYGMNYLNTINRTWVLSRLAIEMDEMPESYDKFFVETWVEGAMKYFTSRNFKVSGEDGRIYGYGRSIWAMIDTVSRQPVDILSVHDGLIAAYIEKEKECPIVKSSRVPVSLDDTELVRTVRAVYHDIDINGHVNSVKYIEHVLDLWDLDWYTTYKLHRFEIAYVAESHVGDDLKIYRQAVDVSGENTKEYNIIVTKSAKTDDKEVEVVRCRANFVKE